MVDYNKIALQIVSLVDYDIYKEIKEDPFEDGTLEAIKDELQSIYEEAYNEGYNEGHMR